MKSIDEWKEVPKPTIPDVLFVWIDDVIMLVGDDNIERVFDIFGMIIASPTTFICNVVITGKVPSAEDQLQCSQQPSSGSLIIAVFKSSRSPPIRVKANLSSTD